MLLNTVVNTIKRKSHRGNQTITTDQITTDIVACVNEAIRDCSKEVPKRYWWKKETLITATGTIAVPYVLSLAADTQSSIQYYYVVNNSVWILSKMDSDKEWISKIWNINQTPLKPMFYREIGPDGSGKKQIEIFPMPDGVYSITHEYYKAITSDLTTTNLGLQIPDFPDYVQDAIEKGALYYFLKGFDDAAAAIAKSDYEQAKEAMNVSDERDTDSDNRLRWNMTKSNLLPPGFRPSGTN